MKNEHVLELIDEYVDGELDVETREAVEAHLASCPECRGEAESLKRLMTGLGKLPLEIEPPDGFVRDLPALPERRSTLATLLTFRKNGSAVHRGPFAESRGAGRLLSPAFIGRAAAVLAVVVVGGAAWYLLRPASPDGRIAQTVAPERNAVAELPPPPEEETAEPAAEGIKSAPARTQPRGEAATKPDRAAVKPGVRKDTGPDAENSKNAKNAEGAASRKPPGTTGSLTGTVRDAISGKGLPGVSIVVIRTPRAVTTDPNGWFAIRAISPGEYTVRADAAGYNISDTSGVRIEADSTSVVEFSIRLRTGDVAAVTTANAAPSAARSADGPVVNGTRTVPKEAIEGISSGKNAGAAPELQAAEGQAAAPQATQSVTGDNTRSGRAPSGESRGIIAPSQHSAFALQPPRPDEESLGETYDRIYENGWRDAEDQPKSTFSIDVDAASYSNVRRFLNNGQLPPVDAVRIEEMVNYFKYAYPVPERDRPLSVLAEMAECPWNRQNLLLMVGIRGRQIDPEDLPPANLVFLIDVSGSMKSADKLPLLRDAFRYLVDQLRPEDRVSIVVYAGQAGLVLPTTRGDRKRTILGAIDGLSAGGSTAGGAGIRLAYSQAREAFIEGGNNRVILATDGDFNVGVSSDEEMVKLIEREREDGIFLSVIGVGTGNLKDSKMEKIADKGNGAYYYLDGMREARKVFGRQLSGTLYTIAKDVKIQMEFDPGAVESYRLIGYENRVMPNRDFRDDRKDAGDLGSGHTVTALYEIVPVDRGRDGDEEVAMSDGDGRAARRGGDRDEEIATVSIRYKEPDATTSRELRQGVREDRPEIDDASENLRFAAAVAEFGMMLRDSGLRGTASYRQILRLAESAIGRDSGGDRAEFVRLVEKSEDLLER